VDLKGTNGVSSLHLISKLIIQSDPILYDCVNDLAPLKTLKNSSLKALYDEISEVERQFKKIESEIDRIPAYESSPLYTPQDDLFIARIQQLYKDTTDKVQFLGVEQSLLKQEVAKVFRFFGEKETPDLTPEILIGYLIKFLSAFEVVHEYSQITFLGGL
jgi:Formin Homology 2 Domain